MREEKEVWVKRIQYITTCDMCGETVEHSTTCSICERNICKECWGENKDRKIGSDILFEYACPICQNVQNANDIINKLVTLRIAEDKAMNDRYDLMEKWKDWSRDGC